MENSKRVLVTGAAGLAGRWLLQRLAGLGNRDVFCTDMQGVPSPIVDAQSAVASPAAEQRPDAGAPSAATPDEGTHVRTRPEIANKPPTHNWITGDICDRKFADTLVRDTRPDEVYHFAGLLGNANPDKLAAVNAGGTECILGALIAARLEHTRVLVTSSSAVYGDKGETPVSEDLPLTGTSNYSLSKIAQEKIAHDFHAKYNLPVIVSRAFNNIAPGERETMFISRIAVQIVRIERGIEQMLRIGPLHSYRDYLDTRDLVDGYIALMANGVPGEAYNVCSEEAVLIEELFRLLIDRASVPIGYEIIDYDQSGNIPYQRGSAARIRERTGWKKSRDIRHTVIEILDYWRTVLR